MPPMAGSRTIKTLAALVASLVIGTFTLILLETPPASPTVPLSLHARRGDAKEDLDVVSQLDNGMAIQYLKWRNVIVHDTGRDGAEVASRCHFLIGRGDSLADGTIQATVLWRRQLDGDHIRVPGFAYETNSIGICLLGDGRNGGATPRQFEALVRLVRALQHTCQFPRDHVYLHYELSQPGCPGGLPTGGDTLRARLIRSTR